MSLDNIPEQPTDLEGYFDQAPLNLQVQFQQALEALKQDPTSTQALETFSNAYDALEPLKNTHYCLLTLSSTLSDQLSNHKIFQPFVRNQNKLPISAGPIRSPDELSTGGHKLTLTPESGGISLFEAYRPKDPSKSGGFNEFSQYLKPADILSISLVTNEPSAPAGT